MAFAWGIGGASWSAGGWLALMVGAAGWAEGGGAVVRVDAENVLVEREQSLVGANIEDVNHQLYGGLYSQLIHGECFEEHVDPSDLLGLTGKDRLAVWTLIDETGRPALAQFARAVRLYHSDNPVDRPSDAERSADETKVGGLVFRGGVILPEELPGDLGEKLVALATGDEQVSRHWRKVRSGSAAGSLQLVRQGAFTGRQAQRIAFRSGLGELGIDNAGLFRWGINLVGGKPYEGILRIQSDTARQVFVSLRGEGGEALAEQALSLDARPGEYQRLAFTLTPKASDPRGRFALTLKQPGEITVDFAFLQAGEWGRFDGLPVRKDLAEAMIGMGVKTMRYNGSMVNKCIEGAQRYKWKQMIGPRDERQPYHGFFDPYSSHGFSVFEFMDFCEAAGIYPLFGLRIDETEQDMADLVEYCLGGAETEWGARRIANGHPRPYFLKAIQIGNEQTPNAEYVKRVEALGAAIWSKSRDVDVVLSCNVGRWLSAEDSDKGAAGGAALFLANMIEMARWAREQGQEAKFVLDSHYLSALDHADRGLPAHIGLPLNDAIAKALPGFNLRLWPMEENGDRYDWERGLAHAHNLNTMNRMPPCLERAGVANTFQAWEMNLFWDQGRIHYTPSQVFFQPSYYVDRMFGDEWLPLVVQAESSEPTVDATAKKDREGKTLTIYLVNTDKAAATVSLDVAGFAPVRTEVARIRAADLTDHNTPQEPERVATRMVDGAWDPGHPVIELPGYSFTAIRLGR
ncbi:MAG: hypothetical protein NTW86_11270 [Candidatus Sumerlaeota bacterium]|nr:hypothetical protein [Candidatus Sumerlaeota bacterium]